MRNLDAVLDELRKARVISKIDLRQAFMQVLVEESSRKYTAFAVPGSGLFQFRKMPFGLVNSPKTFSRLIDLVFGPDLEEHIFSYLDDIILISEDFENHLKSA